MTQSWRPPDTLSPCGVRSVQLSLRFRYRILISFPKPSPEHYNKPVGQDIITTSCTASGESITGPEKQTLA